MSLEDKAAVVLVPVSTVAVVSDDGLLCAAVAAWVCWGVDGGAALFVEVVALWLLFRNRASALRKISESSLAPCASCEEEREEDVDDDSEEDAGVEIAEDAALVVCA